MLADPILYVHYGVYTLKTASQIYTLGFLLVIITMFFSGCVMNRLSSSPDDIVLRESLEGRKIEIRAVSGKSWSEQLKAGPFIINVLPQVAIWMEDGTGNLIDTVYVSGAGSAAGKHAKRDENKADFYRECLPVWASRQISAGRNLPSDTGPLPDSISSATPQAGFRLNSTLAAENEEFLIFLEINKSGDTNETFTEENSGWAGQPSLVYSVHSRDLSGSMESEMILLGHGGTLPNADGSIYLDLTGFTTALIQLDRVSVSLQSN